YVFFFFSSRRRHTRLQGDWSSDVCSSDLANGRPTPKIVLLVLGCMITARTAAMLFNRFADWEIDQHNPRTQNRHLLATRNIIFRSEERRVGKECRCRWGRYDYKKKEVE